MLKQLKIEYYKIKRTCISISKKQHLWSFLGHREEKKRKRKRKKGKLKMLTKMINVESQLGLFFCPIYVTGYTMTHTHTHYVDTNRV